MDHVHTVLAGRRAALADIGQAGEARLAYRPPFGVTHDIPGELPLARIVALGIERKGLAGASAETAGDRRVVVARMANIDRWFRRAGADADRHQHRLDAVVAKAMRPASLVQHHVLRAQSRFDHLVAPGPADRQYTVEHEEMLDDLVGMAGSIFA